MSPVTYISHDFARAVDPVSLAIERGVGAAAQQEAVTYDLAQVVDPVGAILQRDINGAADEGVVWLTLDRLEKAHLLRERLTRPANEAKISRREVLRKLGLAAASVLAPVVTSLAAPTRARGSQQMYCQYKILRVHRSCDITPTPAVGTILFTDIVADIAAP